MHPFGRHAGRQRGSTPCDRRVRKKPGSSVSLRPGEVITSGAPSSSTIRRHCYRRTTIGIGANRSKLLRLLLAAPAAFSTGFSAIVFACATSSSESIPAVDAHTSRPTRGRPSTRSSLAAPRLPCQSVGASRSNPVYGRHEPLSEGPMRPTKLRRTNQPSNQQTTGDY